MKTRPCSALARTSEVMKRARCRHKCARPFVPPKALVRPSVPLPAQPQPKMPSSQRLSASVCTRFADLACQTRNRGNRHLTATRENGRGRETARLYRTKSLSLSLSVSLRVASGLCTSLSSLSERVAALFSSRVCPRSPSQHPTPPRRPRCPARELPSSLRLTCLSARRWITYPNPD